jgi:diguanylate cyclase (GGDEF)-like protein
MYSRLAQNPIVLAGLFAVYFGLGKVGLAIGGFHDATTALWPPSGFALAAVVIFGRSVWRAIAAGSFFVYWTSTGYVLASMTIAVGNTFEALLGAALIDRLAGGANVFTSARTVFRFASIAAIGSTPISATLGATAIAAHHAAVGPSVTGLSPFSNFAYDWMTWWLANLTGILVVAPFTMLWTLTPTRRVSWIELGEAIGLLGMLVGVGFVVFGGGFPSDIKDYPLEFLCVPFLLWAAFRFGRRETATAVVILSGLAVWGTLRGFGPFARETPNESLVLVQAYTSVMAIMGMVLAAVVAEHKHAEAQLTELATTDPLTGLVNYRRLIEVMRGEIARSSRTRRPFAVLFVDMNGLKKINDKHGHLAGSRALCRVADALRKSCRTTDTPARFGGDEFAIVLPETGDEGGQLVLARVAERLAADTDRPVLSVSGGVAVFPRDGDTPTLLLRAADQSLYEAKARAAAARKAATGERAAHGSEPRRTGTLF